MTKNISLVGINYAPEDSAIGLYSTQLTEHLFENGFAIDVVTGVPYYPQWKVRAEYKSGPLFVSEVHKGIHVHRYKQYVPEKPSFAKRIVHLLDFTLGSLRNLFKVKKCDLVIAIVPFTTSIVLALLLAKLRGAKVWVHIQDFEFDAAKDAGLVEGKSGVSDFIFGVLIKIESWLLRRADIASTISYSMMKKLEEKTGKPAYFFPNWINPADINPETAQPHGHLASDKFKVLYSGNIGAKQDWDTFVKVAEHYRDNTKVEFVVVGAGAAKDNLLARINDLPNVQYHPPVDFCDLSSLLCSADLHVLFQKDNVIDTVMPSKILGMMASATPSLVTGNHKSEVATLFEDSKGGYFLGADDVQGIITKIDFLQQNPQSAKDMGVTARGYITGKFGNERVLGQVVEKIEEILSK